MESKIFGYARVSTKEQNEARQVKAILDYCNNLNLKIDERDILIDKQSGKDFKRDKYLLLKQMLRSGDTLIIKELDRLGRNKEEIKSELDYFKKNNIRVKILNIPTTLMDLPEGNEWVMDMVNNILIEVLGAIAEEERNKIKSRQKEGIEIAKAQGKHLGRPRATFPDTWNWYYLQWKNKDITAVKAMEIMGLKRNTFYKLVKEYEKENGIL